MNYTCTVCKLLLRLIASSIPDNGKERVPPHGLPRAEESAAAAAALAPAVAVVGRRRRPGPAGEDGVVAEEAQRDDAPRARQGRVARRAVNRLAC